MLPRRNRAYYRCKPIGSITALCKHLDVPIDALKRIANYANNSYRIAKIITKDDGSLRYTYDAFTPLKEIQRKINLRIFRNVYFPEYLQGGIKDKSNPRHYKRNTELHTNKSILISEDISNYFPSTSAKVVNDIWQRFFHFPPELALLLTKLTTKDEALVQGSITSTTLSNLAFWELEPSLVEQLSGMGFTYSRFIDDITISSDKRIDNEGKTEAISLVFGMLIKKGVKAKRAKHAILSPGMRMHVHRVNVNTKNATLPKEKRSAVRAAVHHCELRASSDRTSNEYKKMYSSALGKVHHLLQFHPKEGRTLKERLVNISPIV